MTDPAFRGFSRRGALTTLGAAILSGCASGMDFPVSEAGQSGMDERGVRVIRITQDNIASHRLTVSSSDAGFPSNPPLDPKVYVYRIGVGDQLRIQAWTTPERRLAGEQSAQLEGPVVNEAGEVFYPYVGMIKANGLSASEFRTSLQDALRKFIADPQIEVEVEEFKAHQVTLVGEVAAPGATTLNNIPLRLLDLINTAGSTDLSDLRQVEVRRAGVSHKVNLRSYIDSARPGQNPILLPGDTVFVPAMSDNKVFVFGEIGTGEVALGKGSRTLTEVLAAKGGLANSRANARGIFVFRRPLGQINGFDVYQFDLSDAAALMLTSQFEMAPMDVVFVTTDPITQWNDSVGKLISPVAGIIQAKAVADVVVE